VLAVDWYFVWKLKNTPTGMLSIKIIYDKCDLQ
jgi:hypothetical protein